MSVGQQVFCGLAPTVHASISDNTFADAKGSVYDSLLQIHFCNFRIEGSVNS